jgi:hypothetical protein
MDASLALLVVIGFGAEPAAPSSRPGIDSVHLPQESASATTPRGTELV